MATGAGYLRGIIIGNRLRPGFDRELIVDVRQVEFHRIRGDPQPFRQFAVRQAGGQRFEDGAFLGR